MFYFQQMFLNALDGIDSRNITSGVVGIASTILIISFLYGAYQAFANGGDVRALGISGIKYLILGLVFASYPMIFRDVNSMFNSVAQSITNLVSATDMFSDWMTQLQVYWTSSGTQSLWSIIGGVGASLSGFLDAWLIILGFIIMPLTYALFALFYSLYGSILYVTGPLVLALLPANGVGQLARTYLVNMLIFQAWGLLYAIFSALMVVLNVNSVSNVLNSGGVAGFFRNASQDLLLALASILFSICIALIPFLASRIVRGDVGSTILVFLRSFSLSSVISAGAGSVGKGA
jgi:hypothetical protein